MQIKRKIEMFCITSRRYIVRRSSSAENQISCAACGEPMLSVEQAAKIFGINQRRIFQIIETGATHFNEIEAGAAMICLSSLAAVLDDESGKNQN